MVFRRLMLAASLALPLWSGAVRANEGFFFDGINTRLTAGAFVPHPFSIENPSEAERGTAPQIRGSIGFVATAGLGFWFSLPFGVGAGSRWRLELESGFSRYQIEDKGYDINRGDRSLGKHQGEGSVSAFNFWLNNYFHFLDRFSFHQPYIGIGAGGHRFSTEYFSNGGQRDRSLQWVGGINAHVGYDYRVTRQLSVGVSYRYSHFWVKPQNLHRSEGLVSISYGF